MNENRQYTRYNEIGRVVATDLCGLPGILDDISLAGCRIHFPCIVSVDMEAEYKIKITLSRSPEEAPLQLLCKPKWVEDYEDSTHLGLMYMYSPDENRLRDFIKLLEDVNNDDYSSIM